MLAHSLRDAGTTKKLAVLVTLDSVSSDVITQLKASLLPGADVSVLPATPLPPRPAADGFRRLSMTM